MKLITNILILASLFLSAQLTYAADNTLTINAVSSKMVDSIKGFRSIQEAVEFDRTAVRLLGDEDKILSCRVTVKATVGDYHGKIESYFIDGSNTKLDVQTADVKNITKNGSYEIELSAILNDSVAAGLGTVNNNFTMSSTRRIDAASFATGSLVIKLHGFFDGGVSARCQVNLPSGLVYADAGGPKAGSLDLKLDFTVTEP